MAFTGTPVIAKVSESCFRITGVSLGIGATGTVGLSSNAGAEVKLNAPEWNRYVTSGLQGGQIELDQSVEATVVYADAASTTVEPVSVTKTGDGPTDFLLTFTNRDAALSGALEIYVKYHGG